MRTGVGFQGFVLAAVLTQRFGGFERGLHAADELLPVEVAAHGSNLPFGGEEQTLGPTDDAMPIGAQIKAFASLVFAPRVARHPSQIAKVELTGLVV
ncbi:hypothetical protein R20233_04976 [Ralstonia sp. LMG 32965]|nr:hypothetical protein R20233_04976 [Ralstonia sp. LMG 32965]